MTPNGKEGLHEQIAYLAQIEKHIRGIAPQHRDHVIHAFLSFALGIYLQHEYFHLSFDSLQWKISALFHDIAYPAEVASTNFLMDIQNKLNNMRKRLHVRTRPDVVFEIVPKNLARLENGDSFDFIQSCLEKWELEVDAKAEYNACVSSGKVCHGMLSALILLYAIDMLYESHNSYGDIAEYPLSVFGEGYISWDRRYFTQKIVPACSAIFIHNLDKKHFIRKKILRERAPLAFMLKLVDTLQEWDRPLKNMPQGYPSKEFGVKIEGDKLFFGAPTDIITKIVPDMASFFAEADVEDIQIVPMRPDLYA
jgi:hypothetical protein